jgi:tight adherence protein B
VTTTAVIVGALLVCGQLPAARAPSARRLATLAGGDPRKSPGRRAFFAVTAVTAGAAGAGLIAVVGVTPTVLAVTAGAVVAVAARRAQARRADAAVRAGVVQLLRAVAGELRAGRPAGAAFAVAAESAAPPLRAALTPLAPVAADGDAGELAAALRAVAARDRGLAGLARFASCWQVAVTSGASLAPAVDRVADALHDQIELSQALDASLAAPRATVRLLAALPVVGLALGGVLGARPLKFLLGAPAGLCCLVAAIGFDVAGVLWGRRIAHRATFAQA